MIRVYRRAPADRTPLRISPILAKKTGDWALTTKDFEQWCVDNLPGVSRGEFGAWNWAGSKEEEEKVHQLLFEPDMSGVKPALRRRASDLAGWPEVNPIVDWVELDCAAHRFYKLAWKEFKEALEGLP